MSEPALNASVSRRTDLTPGLALVQVKPEGWELPAFEPGRYTTLGLPLAEAGDGKLVKRVYSIASPPGLDHLELYILLIKHGELTRRLWPLREGDPLFVSPRIVGRFTLEQVPADKDVVLVATGTGLAPYISMLRHYRGKRRWRRVVIVHGVRHVADLGYRQLLETIAREDEDVTYIPTVTREPDDSDWRGQRSRVQTVLEGDSYAALVGAALDPGQCHVFLCGNPAMIDEMEQQLVAQGFSTNSKEQPGNLHFERYW